MKLLSASSTAAGLAAVLMAIGACDPPPPGATVTHPCAYNAGLGDRACTPGVARVDVTQDSISTTICIPGWPISQRLPIPAATKRGVRSEYGVGSVIDHAISIELGGDPVDIRNLQMQTSRDSHAKDRVENRLHALVCNGAITLAAAQALVLNWRSVPA